MDHSQPARKNRLDRARALFKEAHDRQVSGEIDEAISLYLASIEQHPTAEAHTFLGWTYSHQGRLEDAIAECRKAIDVDPGFGNPYNDIGAYLIELKRHDEAIPWLERATEAERYETYQFPWYNLGRVYEEQDQLTRAISCYVRALEYDADYAPARTAAAAARRKIN